MRKATPLEAPPAKKSDRPWYQWSKAMVRAMLSRGRNVLVPERQNARAEQNRPAEKNNQSIKVLAARMAALSDVDWVQLVSAAQRTKRMDYTRHDIRLAVASDWERMRLKSSKKEPWTIEWIESYVKPGDVFFDIGANVGAYSLVAAKFTGGQARVYAFEPGFTTFASLCKNIILNDCQECITPLPVALTAETKFFTFKYSSVVAGASLHLVEERGAVKAGVPASAPAEYEQPVLGYRLDDLLRWFDLPAPNHIKLDVDGCESDVLQGAADTLANPALKTMLMEINESAAHLIDKVQTAGLHLVLRFQKFDKPGRPLYGLFARSGAALSQ